MMYETYVYKESYLTGKNALNPNIVGDHLEENKIIADAAVFNHPT